MDCMNRFAQHLNGLRSTTRLQHDLTQAARNGKVALALWRSMKQDLPSFSRRLECEVRAATKSKTVETDPDLDPEIGDEEAVMLQAAAVMFSELVDDTVPHLMLYRYDQVNLTLLHELFILCARPRVRIP